MNTPTQILSAEHKNILKVIDAMLAECVLIEQGNEIDKIFFEEFVSFIRNYADRFHHAKEEDILFVELGKDGISMPAGPVKQMLLEHDMGRDYIQAIVERIEKNDKEKVTENARQYCQLLQQHIYKEDNILYPMADQVLDATAQDNMLEQFKKVENETFSKEEINKYLDFVEKAESRHKKDVL